MTTPQEELPPLKILLTHLEWNLKRMAEVQREEKTDYFRDAALQRYGFTCDSALRCIRAGALPKNQPCETVAECFELAAGEGWWGRNADWQAMVTAHAKMNSAARQEHVDAIYEKLSAFQTQLKNLYHSLDQLA